LYHHPELALSHGVGLAKGEAVFLSGNEEKPVFLMRGDSGSGLVAYALLYEEEFIDDPISHQIGNSLSLLFSRRKPMTLFYIEDKTASRRVNLENSDVGKLLSLAVDSFYSKNDAMNANRLDNR
jgi:hypothetical protein